MKRARATDKEREPMKGRAKVKAEERKGAQNAQGW